MNYYAKFACSKSNGMSVHVGAKFVPLMPFPMDGELKL